LQAHSRSHAGYGRSLDKLNQGMLNRFPRPVK
jgi:hypothetical protein